MEQVLVPAPRWPRWQENFAARHGGTATEVVAGALVGTAQDGSCFEARLALGRDWGGPLDPVGSWGVLLVRKGGFAIGRVEGTAIVDSKVGQRHVQGRTKAGGQSQQRFARRRDNQARAAYDAAAGHAVRILEGVGLVVAGGDRDAVESVLADPRLREVRVVDPWLPVPDPRRAVLEQAVVDGASVRVRVVNA